MLAIAGPSGAGKSTLVNLLMRFWEPDRGSLALGGVDLCCLDPESLRRAVAVLPQHIYLFNLSLRDNLLLADPDASQEQILQACRDAGLESLLQSLPDGLDTWIGESGFRLSGGERQRLALARALLKDSRLLVLDEPTANLDLHNVQAIRDMLRRRKKDQAVLLITHQLDLLQDADEIILLDQGQPVERGTYARLMQQRGLFWRLCQLEESVRLDFPTCGAEDLMEPG